MPKPPALLKGQEKEEASEQGSSKTPAPENATASKAPAPKDATASKAVQPASSKRAWKVSRVPVTRIPPSVKPL